MICLVGSKALAAHGIYLPRPQNHKQDFDFLLDEEGFYILYNRLTNPHIVQMNTPSRKAIDSKEGTMDCEIVPLSLISDLAEECRSYTEIPVAVVASPVVTLILKQIAVEQFPECNEKHISDIEFLKSQGVDFSLMSDIHKIFYRDRVQVEKLNQLARNKE